MDDLRAAMDTEVRAVNARLSKKFLKNNRPRSLAVVLAAAAALLLLLALPSHKASSVTPVALRTAETVLASSQADGDGARPLSPDQRQALLDLLDGVKVRRADRDPGRYSAGAYWRFRFQPQDPEAWFSLEEDGYLCVPGRSYQLTGDAAAFWDRLEAVLGA